MTSAITVGALQNFRDCYSVAHFFQPRVNRRLKTIVYHIVTRDFRVTQIAIIRIYMKHLHSFHCSRLLFKI